MSVFLKVSRAVDGDDWFVRRVQIACEVLGHEYTRDVAVKVALDHADHIDVDENYTVETVGVTDSMISETILELQNPGPDPEPEPGE